MEKFDVCVIGAGPAGYAAAMRALDFGKRVALIEKNQLGGAGIHQGALWSKTWWEISREARMLNLNKKALGLKEPYFQYKKINEEVMGAVNHRVNLLSQHLDDINHSLEKDVFKYIQGTAKVIDKHHVKILNNGTVNTHPIRLHHLGYR